MLSSTADPRTARAGCLLISIAALSLPRRVDTRSAGGRLDLHVLASVSQWEREAVGGRTRTALEHLRSRGTRLGSTSFGLRRVVGETGSATYDVADDEKAVIDEIADFRDGGLSYRQIAGHLTLTGRPTKRHRRWHASTVRGIFERAA